MDWMWRYYLEPLLTALAIASALAFAGYAAYALVVRSIALGVRRGRRASAAIFYVAQAVRLNLPLPEMMRAAAAGERGAMRARLTRLADRLAAGEPVGDALRASVPEMPDRPAKLLTAAERLGQLPAALERLSGEVDTKRPGDVAEGAFYPVYACILVAAITGIVSMEMVFVIPKFEQIFKDFHTDLPGATVSLLNVSRFFSQTPFASLPLFLLPPILGFLLLTGWWSVLTRRFQPIIWRVFPPAQRLAEHRALGDVCLVLASATAAGYPLTTALAEASTLAMPFTLRDRIAQWRAAVDRGQRPGEAANDAGLPRLVSGLLAGVEISGPDALPGALDFLAHHYDYRFSRLAAFLRGAVVPVTVAFFGVIVGWVSLALFAPLISLIQAVSGPAIHLR